MRLPNKRLIHAITLVAMLTLLWACGDPAPMQPREVIDKAVSAMQGVQSLHFALTTSKLDQYPPGIFITGAEGDVAQPDKLQATATAILLGTPIEVRIVGVEGEQFMTDPASGRWASLAGGLNVVGAFDPNKGISDILANVQDLQSDGTESIDGTATYRLKASVSPEALRALSTDVNATNPLSTTLWIGAEDFRLRQVVLNGQLMTSEPATIVRTIKFSKFNEPVDITKPVIGTSP